VDTGNPTPILSISDGKKGFRIPLYHCKITGCLFNALQPFIEQVYFNVCHADGYVESHNSGQSLRYLMVYDEKGAGRHRLKIHLAGMDRRIGD
jgi:hypothetical protein